jgi:hypothetical protein
VRWPRRRTETDLEREIRDHLETLTETYQRNGMSPEEAGRAARADFGGVELIKDQCRDESRWSWLARLGQDLRFGWRMMRKLRRSPWRP